MSEQTPEAAGGQQQVPLTVHGQYIKDFSFEVPGAPSIFLEQHQGQPQMDLNLDVQVEGLSDELFEVSLVIKAETRIAGQTGYILELKYAGVFSVRAAEDHRAAILFVECPRLLFPFARSILADVSREGGFQPLILGPVDFGALFEQNLDQIRKQTADAD